MLRVAPNPDVAQTLLGLGIKSATQIATLGEQQFFLKATAAGLTKPEANQAFQAAAQRYANVVSLYMQFNRDSIGVWPQAMGQAFEPQAAGAAGDSARPVSGHAVWLAGLLRHRRLHFHPEPGRLSLRPAPVAAQPPAGYADGA